MRRQTRGWWWLVALLLSAGGAGGQYREDAMEPDELGIRDLAESAAPSSSYLGNDVCRLCHEEAYQRWLGTAHARAFVMMRSMMAMEMGRQQGITACCPARSGKCLGCHGTAHDVPAAYRGPGFRIGEGVTCEKCHGPGGAHVAARDGGGVAHGAAGMHVPERGECLSCHAPKESHAALGKQAYDLDKAWRAILHPRSAERPEDQLEPAELGIQRLAAAVSTPASPYAGSGACAECHAAAYAAWTGSAHAGASRALRSQMGVMMGMRADMNVIGGPSKDAECLRCHATAHDVPARFRAPGFRMLEGVGCEHCHGPGQAHVEARRGGADDPGLAAGEATDCMACHRPQRSHEALERPPFDRESAWARIAH